MILLFPPVGVLLFPFCRFERDVVSFERDGVSVERVGVCPGNFARPRGFAAKWYIVLKSHAAGRSRGTVSVTALLKKPVKPTGKSGRGQK